MIVLDDLHILILAEKRCSFGDFIIYYQESKVNSPKIKCNNIGLEISWCKQTSYNGYYLYIKNICDSMAEEKYQGAVKRQIKQGQMWKRLIYGNT